MSHFFSLQETLIFDICACFLELNLRLTIHWTTIAPHLLLILFYFCIFFPSSAWNVIKLITMKVLSNSHACGILTNRMRSTHKFALFRWFVCKLGCVSCRYRTFCQSSSAAIKHKRMTEVVLYITATWILLLISPYKPWRWWGLWQQSQTEWEKALQAAPTYS